MNICISLPKPTRYMYTQLHYSTLQNTFAEGEVISHLVDSALWPTAIGTVNSQLRYLASQYSIRFVLCTLTMHGAQSWRAARLTVQGVTAFWSHRLPWHTLALDTLEIGRLVGNEIVDWITWWIIWHIDLYFLFLCGFLMQNVCGTIRVGRCRS